MLGQHELILNHITAGEFMPPFRKDWDSYKRTAYLFLNHKGKHLFEEDILSEYRKDVTLESLFKQNDEQYFQGANHVKNGVNQKTWYDIWSTEEIERNDDFFDYFFAIKLRHLSLLDIDDYLTFHLDYSFKNQKKEYFRFVQLTLRSYGERYLNPQIIETVNEWVKANEANESTDIPEAEKGDIIKGRRQRHPGDDQTSLSLKQTALLIGYMKDVGIILNDGVKDTHAGKAFSILTGYSAHSLRMQLGTKGMIDGPKHEDYKELLEVIKKLANLIEADIRKK